MRIRVHSVGLAKPFEFGLSDKSTVEDVKGSIRVEHPEHPACQRQVLICQGRILNDDQRLTEDDYYLLLCPGQVVTKTPLSAYSGYHLISIDGQYSLAPILTTASSQSAVPDHHFITAPSRPTFTTPPRVTIRLRFNPQPFIFFLKLLRMAVLLVLLCQEASVWEIAFYHSLALLYFLYEMNVLPSYPPRDTSPTFWNQCKRFLFTFLASLSPAYPPPPQ